MGRGLLQRVAGDVVATGSTGDAAAFAATFERLMRLIEGALSAACAPRRGGLTARALRARPGRVGWRRAAES